MTFDANNASILQGKKNDVTNKLQVSHASHMQDIVWHIEVTLQCDIYQI
jgi:hypothetical protein